MQAETRVVPTETKPNCPFPSQLQIVPPLEQGRVSIAAPIDIPFTEVNKILEVQLKGRKFPDDPNAAAEVTVQRASVAPSGDRLLISLQVKAHEKRAGSASARTRMFSSGAGRSSIPRTKFSG